nr:reverse transcriptase family protein [Nostoc sp. DedSLP01]
GDMNGRIAVNGDDTANGAGDEIVDFANRFDMCIANTLPVACGGPSFRQRSNAVVRTSTVDYALIDSAHDSAVTALQICADDCGIGSDHKPLLLELTFKADGAPALHPQRPAPPPNAPARPRRSEMRPDNADLTNAIDAAAAQWLSANRPDAGIDATAIDALERSLTHALDSAAVAATATGAGQRRGTNAPNAGGRGGQHHTAKHRFGHGAALQHLKMSCAIANAARRLMALRRRHADAPLIARAQQQLKHLHAKRQRATRNEWRRHTRSDEQMLYRCGDEASAYDKLQRVIGLSKRSRSRGTTKGVHALMDDTGRVVTDAHAIAAVFRIHIGRSSAAARELTADETELLQRTAATPLTCGTANLRTPATEDEVRRHIKHLQNGRAAGPDGTYPELLKIGGTDTVRAVTALFNAVLRTGVWPMRWSEGDVVPIPKPGGDTLQANDYRGITLLPVLSKLLEAVLNTRLSRWLEEKGALHDAQHGFRPGRCTLDAAFMLHELVAATRETATRSRRTAAQRTAQAAPAPTPHHTIFIAYLDVRKAYDECWRQAIIAQLRARGVDAHTCALFDSMLAAGKVRRTVRVNGVRSEEFGVDVGVPQGAVLSPALYNTFIDGIARALEADPRGFGAVAHGIRIPSLLYADDIALFAHSAEQLQQMLDVCAQYAQRWRFSFNATKCAVQIVGRDAAAARTRSAEHPFTIADGTGQRHSVQIVETFKYLGLRPDFSQAAGHS